MERVASPALYSVIYDTCGFTVEFTRPLMVPFLLAQSHAVVSAWWTRRLNCDNCFRLWQAQHVLVHCSAVVVHCSAVHCITFTCWIPRPKSDLHVSTSTNQSICGGGDLGGQCASNSQTHNFINANNHFERYRPLQAVNSAQRLLLCLNFQFNLSAPRARLRAR
jgi:hypothetical protein